MIRYTFLIFLTVTMMPFSFLRAAKMTPEETFWNWFREHENELHDFERDQERIFDQLTKALTKVDENLTFEFGPKDSDGKREFVISAGGIKSAFPKVESLACVAPKLDRWIIVKFRPRRTHLNDLQFKDKTIKAAQVKYLLFKDENPERVGVMLFLPGYREAEKIDFGQIGYLFLDEALGEYDVEMRVGAIVFQGMDSEHAAQAHPLAELATHFDEHFQQQQKE